METFADRLLILRKDKGFTQAELAVKAGMRRTTYADLEKGLSGKTFSYLPMLAKALDCRIDDLFPEMDKKHDEIDDDDWSDWQP